MSALMKARCKLAKVERLVAFYFDTEEDLDRICEVRRQGDRCNSAFGHLQKKLIDNHRWGACENLDLFQTLAQEIHQMEKALCKKGVA